jgi:hypothetical protein
VTLIALLGTFSSRRRLVRTLAEIAVSLLRLAVVDTVPTYSSLATTRTFSCAAAMRSASALSASLATSPVSSTRRL